MKQLTSNPKPDSTAKGWQVMCMGCSTFLPSMDFENYLLNFILEKCQIEGAEVRFIWYVASLACGVRLGEMVVVSALKVL